MMSTLRRGTVAGAQHALDGYGESVRVADRYVIAEAVTRGGEGVIFRAFDERTTDQVALKVTRGDTQQERLRFLRARELATRIDHPNVAQLTDGGLLPDGRAFVVSKWIHGLSLERRDTKARLTLRDVLLVGRATALALAAVHAAGVLHRDVKPGNIIVPLEGDVLACDRALLSDFGLYLDLRERVSEGTARLRIGSTMGTALFQPPEQLLGRSLSEAADLYGLGATLFALVFMQAPMAEAPLAKVSKGSGAPAIYTGELVLRRLTQDVDIPVSPWIPDSFRELMGGLLRRNPNDRPQRAHRVADLIANIRLEVEGRVPVDASMTPDQCAVLE